jgi:hypothetical protein
VVKESELYVILYKLSNHKEKGGGGQYYPDPRQPDDSVTDTRTSQVRLCHVWIRTAIRRADVVGRLVLLGHLPISMPLPSDEAFPSVRPQY